MEAVRQNVTLSQKTGGHEGILANSALSISTVSAKHAIYEALKHLVPSDVVDHERSCSSAVVRAGDSPEALLTCCVPDLQLDFLATHLDYPRTKLHTNRMGTVCHDWRGDRRLRLSVHWFQRILFCYVRIFALKFVLLKQICC